MRMCMSVIGARCAAGASFANLRNRGGYIAMRTIKRLASLVVSSAIMFMVGYYMSWLPILVRLAVGLFIAVVIYLHFRSATNRDVQMLRNRLTSDNQQ